MNPSPNLIVNCVVATNDACNARFFTGTFHGSEYDGGRLEVSLRPVTKVFRARSERSRQDGTSKVCINRTRAIVLFVYALLRLIIQVYSQCDIEHAPNNRCLNFCLGGFKINAL